MDVSLCSRCQLLSVLAAAGALTFSTPSLTHCLPVDCVLLLQVHSEVQAALGGWVPLGRNVTAASAHLMPDGGMMVAYVDGGDDMEKVFNVSHD